MVPIIQAHLVHRFNHQMIAIVPVEALEIAKNMLVFLTFAENFGTLHPDGEKPQILYILTA